MTIKKLKGLVIDQRGATAVEYGLICSLIVIAALTAITTVTSKTVAMWNNVVTAVTH